MSKPKKSKVSVVAEPRYPLGPTLDFLSSLWALEHAFATMSARMEADLGISAEQRMVLRVVGRFPGITPGQVARILCLDAGTISATVRRLEQKRMLVRRKDTRDARRVSLGLTAMGRALDVPVDDSIEGALERVLAKAPAGQSDIVRQFVAALSEELARASHRE